MLLQLSRSSSLRFFAPFERALSPQFAMQIGTQMIFNYKAVSPFRAVSININKPRFWIPSSVTSGVRSTSRNAALCLEFTGRLLLTGLPGSGSRLDGKQSWLQAQINFVDAATAGWENLLRLMVCRLERELRRRLCYWLLGHCTVYAVLWIARRC